MNWSNTVVNTSFCLALKMTVYVRRMINIVEGF